MSTVSRELLTNGQTLASSGLVSLANGSYYALAPIDNTTNQDSDNGCILSVMTSSASTSSTGSVSVYALGSPNGGTTWGEGYAGSAGALTPTSPPNMALIETFNTVANSTIYYSKLFSVAKAFGYLPGKWAPVILNSAGSALNALSSGFTFTYERVQMQSS